MARRLYTLQLALEEYQHCGVVTLVDGDTQSLVVYDDEADIYPVSPWMITEFTFDGEVA